MVFECSCYFEDSQPALNLALRLFLVENLVLDNWASTLVRYMNFVSSIQDRLSYKPVGNFLWRYKITKRSNNLSYLSKVSMIFGQNISVDVSLEKKVMENAQSIKVCMPAAFNVRQFLHSSFLFRLLIAVVFVLQKKNLKQSIR